MQKVAAIILSHYPQAMQDDRIVIKLIYGYNLGVASSSVSNVVAKSPQEWKQLVATPPST